MIAKTCNVAFLVTVIVAGQLLQCNRYLLLAVVHCLLVLLGNDAPHLSFIAIKISPDVLVDCYRPLSVQLPVNFYSQLLLVFTQGLASGNTSVAFLFLKSLLKFLLFRSFPIFNEVDLSVHKIRGRAIQQAL